ncbi:MAG: PAS domain S-box protein [Janthinobacterium lividum]
MAEADTEGLRQRVQELEAETLCLRQAGRIEVDLAVSREALQPTDAHYRLVVESATDFAIFTMDLQRRITSWNTGAEHLLGWPEHEALGHAADMIFTPEDQAAGVPEQEARGAVEQGRAEDVRWHVRRDGSRLWANGLMLPLRDEAGTIQGLLKIFRDQTDQKRTEEQLRGSEARLQALMDQSSAGIAQTTLQGHFIFVNDQYCTLVGRSRDELLSLRMGALTHPDDLTPNLTQFESLALGGRSFEVVKRYLRPDGSSIWVRDSVTAVRDADGRVSSIFAVSLDISEQKRAEMRQSFLLGLADRLRAESTPAGIMARATELLGRHLQVNRVGYGLVYSDGATITMKPGYVAGVQALAGSYVLATFDEESVEALRRGQTVISNDTRNRPTPERWVMLEVGAFVLVPLIRDEGFRACFYVNHCDPHAWTIDEVALIEEVAVRTWDTVDRARAEAALRDANDTLEQRIAAALTEREQVEGVLRQSQKMEAVGQLTGGLAHDFNNLLTGVTGNLELLQTRTTQGRFKDLDRYITAAQGAAKRAAALTQRLLAFSRRQTLAPKPTDVNRLVTGMEEMIRRTVGPATTVEVVEASGLWNTLVDPSQLENALLNLCINARDAMPDGGRLVIETGNKWMDERMARDHELSAGHYVSLCVSDNGTGMSPDVIARAFDPFFTTKPIGQGTGLGLSMIYGFARQSAGQARIYSEEGQGTMVCLYLPRHHSAEAEAEAPAELFEAPRAGWGETVLIVDDEPAVRMLVTEVLEDLGYTAIEAADGAGGLKVLQSDVRIDLLVSDVGLPGGMNGRQMADAGRSVRPDLKVLFITGYAENAVLSHGHLDPGMHVLTKPFALEVLATRIKALIIRTD